MPSPEVVNELVEMAERTDARVEVVSGEDFLQGIGGLAAVMRY